MTITNRIDGVMVSELVSSVVDRGFEPLSGKFEDYEFGICCFFSKHTTLRKNSKDWLAQNLDNLFECQHVYQRTVVSVL